MFRFEPDPGERPIPLVPKDVLLGELLQKFEQRIYKYHEHQSLLENKEEEGLNEEERKAAWEEFENEKKQRNTWGKFFYFISLLYMFCLANLVGLSNMEALLGNYIFFSRNKVPEKYRYCILNNIYCCNITKFFWHLYTLF